MSFEKGKSGNPTGRKKGSINKLTRDVKEVINELLSCMNKIEIKSIYKKVKKDKPEVLINFIGKIAPKTLSVDTTIKTNTILEALKDVKDNLTDNTDVEHKTDTSNS